MGVIIMDNVEREDKIYDFEIPVQDKIYTQLNIPMFLISK